MAGFVQGDDGFFTEGSGFASNSSGDASGCNCCGCTCSLLEGTVSSCFDADETPDTYIAAFFGVSQCAGGGCQDCTWLDGEFCLNHYSGDVWKYTDGNKTITLDLTDAGSTTLVADNNGDICFTGSIQVDGGDCVKGGYIENDTGLGNCSASLCGYGGSAIFYELCSPGATDECCGDSSCVTPGYAIVTVSGLTNCGAVDNGVGCTGTSSIITQCTDFNGTWVLSKSGAKGCNTENLVEFNFNDLDVCSSIVRATISGTGTTRTVLVAGVMRDIIGSQLYNIFSLGETKTSLDVDNCEPCDLTWTLSNVDAAPCAGGVRATSFWFCDDTGSGSLYFV